MTDNPSTATAETELREKIAWRLHDDTAKPLPYCRVLADAILPLLASEIRRARLEEAKWWAEQFHDTPGRGCEKCDRLAELRKGATNGE